MSDLHALVVDDDGNFRASLALLVHREGFEVREAENLEAAHKRIAERMPDVLLVDLGLPDGNGLELLRDESVAGEAELIVITGNASVDSAVGALREGALDYLTKPVDRARLKTVLANVARTRALKLEVRGLRRELRELGRFGPLVGRSPAMQEVYDLIARVAPTDATVFVTGESGTGKELVAETIHRLSPRRDGPMLAVNCGAMSPTLIESELFGHEKGSFTGADRRRKGHFEEAEHGTLLLDEITEMPIELQVKLLRVLESNAVTRVGGSEAIPVDVRVIAASNRDAKRAVADGKLREDLLYRLNVFPISLPPLRERGDDVRLLAEVFLDRLNLKSDAPRRWSEEALAHLAKLAWPGNVRELRNVVERAAILSDGVIGCEALPDGTGAVSRGAPGTEEPGAPAVGVRVGASIAELEKELILATLRDYDGDKKRAADVLGISLKTLYNRLSVYKAADGAA